MKKKVLLFLENIHKSILNSEVHQEAFKTNYDFPITEIQELIKNKDNE